MNKPFASLTATTLMLFSLVGCSNNTTSTTNPISSTTSPVTPSTSIISPSTSSNPISSSVLTPSSTSAIVEKGLGTGLTKEDPLFIGDTGSDNLEIYFIEMTYLYGDSIYLKKGDVDILIDAGQMNDGPYVKAFLEEKCTDKRLDLLVTTHAHSDHIGGMPKALEAIDDATRILDFGYRRESGEGYLDYRARRDELVERGALYSSSYDSVNKAEGCNDIYYISEDFSVEVINTGSYIATDTVWTKDANLTSTTLLFKYKDFTFWTAGDLPTKGETAIMANYPDLKPVTMYKATHHGTNGGNTQDFINKLNPKLVAISAARAGQYSPSGMDPASPNSTYNLNGASGHPSEDAVERFYKIPNIAENLNIYWNMTNGTVRFTTDGADVAPQVQGSPTVRGYYLPVNGQYVWNEEEQRFENKVTGEENKKLHETEVFKIRGYDKFLPSNINP